MITGNKNLPLLKANACADIDTAAETERQLYITEGFGQGIVYVQKCLEANNFLIKYPLSSAAPGNVDNTNWPYLSAEVGITGPTMWAVANTIATNSTMWVNAARQIEKIRLSAKQAINAANNVSAINNASQVIWPSSTTNTVNV